MRAHVRAAAADGDLHPTGMPNLAPRQGFSHPAFAAAGAVLASSAQPLVLWWQRGTPQHSDGPVLLEMPGATGTAAGMAPFLSALLPSQVHSLELRGPDPGYSGRTGPLGAWL